MSKVAVLPTVSPAEGLSLRCGKALGPSWLERPLAAAGSG